ncbi:hypothetical protein TUM17580_47960 [Citrobacter farmeri]|nr:hypothetical protein TUM17580_47960 [Citrobacter farmeri]
MITIAQFSLRNGNGVKIANKCDSRSTGSKKGAEAPFLSAKLMSNN